MKHLSVGKLAFSLPVATNQLPFSFFVRRLPYCYTSTRKLSVHLHAEYALANALPAPTLHPLQCMLLQTAFALGSLLPNHGGVPANRAMCATSEYSRFSCAPFVALNARCLGAPPTQHLDVMSSAGGGTAPPWWRAARDLHTTRHVP